MTNVKNLLLLFGAALLMLMLLASCHVSAEPTKGNIFINDQRIPLEKISCDAEKLIITIPDGYPSFKTGETITLSVREAGALSDRMAKISKRSGYGTESAMQMLMNIYQTTNDGICDWECQPIPLVAVPGNSRQYQINTDGHVAKQYPPTSKSTPKNSDWSYTYDNLPAGPYIWLFGGIANPVILIE